MRRFHTLLSLILCVCLLTCCSFDPTQKNPVENKDFSDFTEQIFRQMAASDSLTLNYTVASPKNFDIKELPVGFSSFTYEDLSEDSTVCENMLAKVQAFDRSGLSSQQKILYDCLVHSLKTECKSYSYTAFTKGLSPTNGIQAQLPVLLAEFHFDDEEDVAQYLALIRSVPDYFQSLLSIEKKKKELGTLPSRETLSRIAGQCDEFIKEDGSSMVQQRFEKKISEVSFLTDGARQQLTAQHQNDLNQYLKPAYVNLSQELRQLISDTGEFPSGNLCDYQPDGSSYYDFLVHETTGSSLSLDEMESLMLTTLIQAKDSLVSLAAQKPSLFSSCDRYAAKFHSSREILSFLQQAIATDFPSIKKSTFEVRQVDESLENYLSPAFYLTPPIDDTDHHVIYLNPSTPYDSSSLYHTLAHEGYPGHLYQNAYFAQTNPPHLRFLLDFGGYSEGWATYAELYSYTYTGLTPEEISILRNNLLISLCLYGLCDLGVHRHGWSKDQLHDFLNQYGSWDEQICASVYQSILDEPASYLKYTVGYLEFIRLRQQMKDELGESYSDQIFHTYVLESGPAPFCVLSASMEPWCKEFTKN